MPSTSADGWRRLPIPIALGLMAASAWVGGDYYERYQDYLGFMVRETAYVSSSFFLLAYLARPLRDVTGATWASTLVRLRRRIGIAAALAHTVHFAAVVQLFRFTGDEVDALTFALGGLGFVLFWALGLTSNDASVRALGGNWKRLHRFGIHYLWLVFFVTYLGDVARVPVFAVFVLAFAGGLGLRVYLFVARRAASGKAA
jgi:DMSO/TMAO reductase YedYZ heme-binding membrane subunit